MAFLQLKSTNPDFSFVISKNPNAPMLAKKLKKGVCYGYYDEDGNYNVFFQDAFDEISFSKSETADFEYLDLARYDSPLFLFSVIRDFFGTALSREIEKDIPADHELFLPSLHIAHGRFAEIMGTSFDGLGIHPNDVGITFSAKEKPLHVFLNYVYAFCVLDLFFGRGSLFIEESVATRLATAMNIIDAPYLPRYLAKMVSVRAKSFLSVKPILESASAHAFVFDPDATSQEARITAVSKYIQRDLDIVDFGAGEGQYLFLSKRLDADGVYFAIDKDERMLKVLERKSSEFDGRIVVSSTFVPALAKRPYVAVLSEVVEHNERKEAMDILLKFLCDKNCRRIILTTPNSAFNINFPSADGFRHPDHKFELDQIGFKNYVAQAVDFAEVLWPKTKPPRRFKMEFFGVGDVVDGEPISQMAVIGTVGGGDG